MQRAGEYITNLSGEVQYKSFRPTPLPLEIDMDAEINKSIIIFKIIIFHKAISIQIGIHKNLNPSKSAL